VSEQAVYLVIGIPAAGSGAPPAPAI